MLIERAITPILRRAAAEYPVVSLIGPRQAGKTTLAKAVFPEKPYVTLESPFLPTDAGGIVASGLSMELRPIQENEI